MGVVCPTAALHLETRPAQQAELALCPGDPDRTRLAARELLEGAQQVTAARGLVGFTGRWRGVPVTVQTTGMGGGSTGIVVNELIELGARVVVRAGTCGGLQPDLAAGTFVIADRVVADDGAGRSLAGPDVHDTDTDVVAALRRAADADPHRTGTVVSTDLFYDPEPGRNERWSDRGILAVEMEMAVIRHVAHVRGVRSGCVLAVSNQLVGPSPGWLGVTDRERAGIETCRIGLDALVSLD